METGWKPTGVSFSGGGARCVGHLGVLSHLLGSGALSQVRNWYGCSAGSFTAVLAAIGGTPTWIHDIVRHFDMSAFEIVEEELVIDFQSSFGVSSGNKLTEYFSRFANTWEPGCAMWTFADLARHRPGITLNITAINLTRGRHVTFNATNTPDMLIFDAVRASCAIPLYFTPWKNGDGELFCDGGVTETYPWNSVTDKSNTLVVICSDEDICGRNERRSITSIGDYIAALGNIIAKNKTVEAPRHWIAVNNRDVRFMDIRISQEMRETLYQEGVAAAVAWDAFRRKAAAPGTRGTRRRFGDPNTLASDHPSPGKTSDSPQSQNRALPPCQTPGSHTGRSRTGRRWSF